MLIIWLSSFRDVYKANSKSAILLLLLVLVVVVVNLDASLYLCTRSSMTASCEVSLN